MNKILCICTKYCAFVQNTVHLYEILCICTKYCACAQNTVHLYKILCICTKYCTFVRNTAQMYKILHICTKYCVSCTNLLRIVYKILCKVYGPHSNHVFDMITDVVQNAEVLPSIGRFKLHCGARMGKIGCEFDE